MRVVTFNIRYTDDINGNSIAERAPRLKKIIDKYDPDIVGFQENVPQWLEILKEYYSKNYIIFNKYRSLKSMESTPIMWKRDKFDLIDNGCFWLSDTPWIESRGKDEIKCNRTVIWATLLEKKTQKKFLYFNTHFGFGDECQIESVRLIKKTVDTMGVQSFIMTGDFNMIKENLGYKEMVKYFTDVNAVTANDERITYHGYGEISKSEEKQIDYCFINDNVDPIGCRIIDDTVNGKFPSDHYGILFELNIKK